MDPNQQPVAPTPTQPQTPPEAPAPTQPQVQPPVTTPEASTPPAQATQGGENPGKTLGIVSLVLGIIGMGLVGLIVGIIGLKKSKKVGMSNGLAVAGIVVSIISIVIGLAIIAMVAFGATKLVQKCQDLGPGTHYENGVTYTCS